MCLCYYIISWYMPMVENDVDQMNKTIYSIPHFSKLAHALLWSRSSILTVHFLAQRLVYGHYCLWLRSYQTPFSDPMLSYYIESWNTHVDVLLLFRKMHCFYCQECVSALRDLCTYGLGISAYRWSRTGCQELHTSYRYYHQTQGKNWKYWCIFMFLASGQTALNCC